MGARFRRGRRVKVAFAVALGLLAIPGRAYAVDAAVAQPGFGLPVDCEIGRDCFVQQMPDMDPGPDIVDPLCGRFTYDGHDGWDIRVRSLRDIARDISVVAVADGIVARMRDGMSDRIVEGAADRERLQGLECGNGVVLEHGDGIVSQYCHLRRGSIAVRPGMQIKTGERLGSIGASGLAEFPHVHLSVRKDDKRFEPLTGQFLEKQLGGCGNTSQGLFGKAARRALARPAVAVLNAGLTGAPPVLSDLVKSGPPPLLNSQDEAVIGWLWVINVRAGDRLRIILVGPDERTLIDHTTEPLDRQKANYLAYAGRRVRPIPGRYQLKVDIIDQENRPVSEIRIFEVAE